MDARCEGERQFVEEVWPSERVMLEQRRHFWALPGPSEDDGAGCGTVGLALSGGGIRSATFCLGVLQVFAKRGLLKWLDYLSTVSGGGYIGATLDALLHYERANPDEPAASLVHVEGEPESRVIEHLRSGGDYLAPHGLLDVLRIPAVLLRGIALNLLMLAPWVGLLALATALQYPNLVDVDGSSTFFFARGNEELTFFVLAPWVLAAFGAWVLLFPAVTTLVPRATFALRSAYEGSFAGLLLLAIVVPLIEATPWIYHEIAYLEMDLRHLGGGLSATLTLLVFAVRSFDRSLQRAPCDEEGVSAGIGWRGKLQLVGIALLGPGALLLVYFSMLRWLYGPPLLELTPSYGEALLERMWLLGGSVALVFVLTRLLININQTGIHGFYRDRLSAAYLFDPETLEHRDALGLSQLDTRKGAPYPLINAALNVPGTKDRNLQGRATDFFLFSPGWCGSFLTGYSATPVLEKVDRHLDLGTAFSISGAAAAPYMGPSTPRLLVFLLTLLNVRLDYWFPNPASHRSAPRFDWLRSRKVGPMYLIAELLGWLNGQSRYVNLSDGGHIENLGLYELLRRRCRFIICCDAEEDPALNLPSLGLLTSYARMDQGVSISWENLSLLRRDERGYSRGQWFYGTIDYGAEGEGQILYLKASLSGREPRDVLGYHAEHPDFPHQSTLDQFFDERQFESYRALGYFIASQLFPERGREVGDIREWFEARKKQARLQLSPDAIATGSVHGDG